MSGIHINGGGGGGGGGGSISGVLASTGGNNTYVSPRDFTAAYASGTTLTLTGIPYVPNIEEFQYVLQIKSDYTRVLLQASQGTWQYSGGTLTIPEATFNASDLAYIVSVSGPDKAYSPSVEALQVTNVTPPWDHTDYELVIDVSGQGDSNIDYYIDMAGYREISVGLYLSCTAGSVTASIDGFTTQDDGTADSSCEYFPVTGSSLVATAATVRGDLQFTKPGKFLRLNILAASVSSSGAWRIRVYKRY